MNIRVTTAILLGGAALMLGAIWPMWHFSLARYRETSPNTDEGGMLMMSTVFTTGFCVIGAGVLIALAIHLRRR